MKSLVWMLCFVVALNGLGFAQATKTLRQKPPAKPADKAETLELPLQQRRALGLLESLVKETIAFDDQPLRIKVQANIAGALWKHNQPRARGIFTEAFEAIDAIEFPPLPTPRKGVPDDAYIAGSERFKLRQEVIHLAALHDLELAEKMRASIAEKSTGKLAESDLKKAKREQVLQAIRTAQLLVKADPLRAAQLFRQVLAGGFEPSLVSVLMEMRLVNPELANTLFLEALASARSSSGLLSDTLGALFYYFETEMDRMLVRNSPPESSRPLILPYLSAVHEAVTRQVAGASEIVLAMDHIDARDDYLQLQQMTPFFAKYLPDALPTIRLRMSQLAKHLPNQEAESIQKRMTSDPDSALKEAESTTDPKQKDRLYSSAAAQLAQQGRHEEAIRLIDKIRDREYRETSSWVVRYQIALRAVSKDEVDVALRYGREIEFSPQRVLIYQKVAESFLSKKDYQHTAEILSEIERWLEASAEDAKKAKGLLDIAALVASYDPMRGFEVMKLAVKAINNADFKPPANKIEVHIKIESLDFARPFAPLARADFERALLITQSIQKKEAAVLAQVEICKAVLAGAQSRKP